LTLTAHPRTSLVRHAVAATTARRDVTVVAATIEAVVAVAVATAVAATTVEAVTDRDTGNIKAVSKSAWV
jgi:hypothetical protein